MRQVSEKRRRAHQNAFDAAMKVMEARKEAKADHILKAEKSVCGLAKEWRAFKTGYLDPRCVAGKLVAAIDELIKAESEQALDQTKAPHK